MLEWGDGFAVINRQGAKAKLIDDNLLRERPFAAPLSPFAANCVIVTEPQRCEP
jgi:hypothetical protein